MVFQKINDLATKFASRITQSWRIVFAGAAFLCLVSVALLIYALQPHETKQKNMEIEKNVQVTSTHVFARALDGVIVSSASTTNLLPYAVMVENSSDAWPLSGPSKANVVVEAPVEGGITRFMLLFDPSSTTTQIGPVRSARPYFVELANGIGSMYVHVGGSPDALDLLRSKTPHVEDLDQFFNAKYFWRSDLRFAPHNVFTSIDKLNLAVSNTRAEVFSFASWKYLDEITSSSTVNSVSIPYQGVYRASWNYDSLNHLYRRSQNNQIQHDTDGAVVDVSNVVVILTDEQVLDEKGRLSVRTTGSGKAVLFRDGTIQEGMWRRTDGEHIRFETNDGRDMFFARGRTWISILTDDNAFAKMAGETISQ